MEKTDWKLNTIDLSIFEYIEKPVLIFSSHGDIIFVNSFTANFLEYNAEELEKHSIFEFLEQKSINMIEGIIEQEKFLDCEVLELTINTFSQQYSIIAHLSLAHQNSSQKLFLLIIENHSNSNNNTNKTKSRSFSQISRFLEDKRLFDKIIESNPYAIAIFDPKGYFLHANKAFYQIFNHEPSESYSLYDDSTLLQKEGFYEGMREIQKGNSFVLKKVSLNFEINDLERKTTDNLNKKWFNLTFFSLYDNEEQVYYPVIIFEDISVQLQFTRKLEDYQKKLEERIEIETKTQKDFFHLNPYGIAIFDEEGNFIESNNALINILGFQLPSDFHLFDISNIKEHNLEEKYQSLLNGNTIEIPLLNLKKHQFNRYPLWDLSLRIIAFPIFNHQKKVERIIFMFEDKTQQTKVKAELDFEREQLLSIFDSFPEITYVYQPNQQKILFANQKLKNLSIHYGPIDDIVFDFQQKVTPALSKMDENHFIENLSIRFEHYNSFLQKYYLLSTRLIKWKKKTIAHMVFAIDITNRRKIEKELKFRLEFQQKLAEISAKFIKSYDISRIIEESFADISEFIKCSEIMLFEFKEHQNRTIKNIIQNSENSFSIDSIKVDLINYWIKDGYDYSFIGNPSFFLKKKSPFFQILQREEWISFRYTKNHPLYPIIFQDIFRNMDETYSVFFPIRHQDMIIGTLLIRFENQIVNKDYFTLLKIYTDLLGNALERESVEIQLSQERQILENVINFNPFGTTIFDGNGYFESCNPVIKRFFKNKLKEKNFELNLFKDRILIKLGLMEKVKKVLKGEIVKIPLIQLDHNLIPNLSLNETLSFKLTIFPVFKTNKSKLINQSDNDKKIIEHIIVITEDLTSMTNTQAILTETEIKYEKLFQNSPIGIAIVDLNGHILEINETQLKLLGCSREEVKNIDPRTLYANMEERKIILDLLEKNERIDKYEIQFKNALGSTYWALISITKFESEKGPLLFISQVDITKEKLARIKLAESERKFHALVESSSDIIWEIDIHGNFVYISPTCYKILGYSPDYFIGRSFDMLSLKPEVKKRIWKDFSNHINKGLLYQQGYHGFQNYIFECYHKNGNIVYLETHGVGILTQDGKLKGFRGVTRNITARKKDEEKIRESESKYRNVVETSDDLIFIIKENGKILFANNSVYEKLNYSKEILDQLNHHYLIHPDDKELFLGNLRKIKSGNNNDSNIEYRFRKQSGIYLLLQTKTRPLLNSEGEIVSFLCVSRDITEIRRKERELRDRELNLQYSNVISMISSMLIHDSHHSRVNIAPILRTLGKTIKVDYIYALERDFSYRNITFEIREIWQKNPENNQELSLLEMPIVNYFEIIAHEKRPSEIIRSLTPKDFPLDARTIMEHLGIEKMVEVPIFKNNIIAGHLIIISTQKSFEFTSHLRKLALNVAILIGFALNKNKKIDIYSDLIEVLRYIEIPICIFEIKTKNNLNFLFTNLAFQNKLNNDEIKLNISHRNLERNRARKLEPLLQKKMNTYDKILEKLRGLKKGQIYSEKLEIITMIGLKEFKLSVLMAPVKNRQIFFAVFNDLILDDKE
ncbi:MAG: PAS domain-containing protein [Candidatus Lokiarchaeota archaeon]|nr:PAS domain-containing protein [Candidatus Harpocratesius repetitus]